MPDELTRLAARCVTVGIHGFVPSPEALALVRRGVGGVIFFARNVESPAQLAALSRALKEAANGPLLTSIDQEGGRVQRLRSPHWTELPSMRRLGELPGAEAEAMAMQAGALLARELSACGIDLDYAPVVDIDTNPANPVIADRSFSRDAQRVSRLAVALARGLEAGGVASCAKHFPGHGDTAQDSHLTLPRLPHDLDRPARRGAGAVRRRRPRRPRLGDDRPRALRGARHRAGDALEEGHRAAPRRGGLSELLHQR